MPSANASALHIIKSPSVNTYSIEKRNTITVIPSKNASSQHLFHRKMQQPNTYSIEKQDTALVFTKHAFRSLLPL